MEKIIPEYCMKFLFIIVNALFVAKYSARIFPKGTIIYNISLYRNSWYDITYYNAIIPFACLCMSSKGKYSFDQLP